MEHVVVGLASELGLGRTLRDERSDCADALEQAFDRLILGASDYDGTQRTGVDVPSSSTLLRPSRRKRTRGSASSAVNGRSR